MNDELQVRELLAVAAELPDEVRPPVTSLLQRGRRQRDPAHRARRRDRRRRGAGGGRPPGDHPRAAARPVPARPAAAFAGLFGGLPSGSPTGPAAARIAGFRWSGLPPSPLGARSPGPSWPGPAAS